MGAGKAAPWKWAVIVGAGVLAVVVWFFGLRGGQKVEFTQGMEAVDLESGQVYFLPVPPQRIFPEVNPDTGKRNLWPVWEEMDGSWMLESRYIGSVREKPSDVKVNVDWSTGRVSTNGKEIRRAN